MPATRDDGGLGERVRNWIVKVVFHPQQEFQGRHLLLEPGKPVELGRGQNAFGDAALVHERLSRQHAVIEVNNLDELHISDQGSRNGTYVNGQRITSQRLGDADVISIGELMLLVSHDSTSHGTFASVLAMAQRMAAADATILISGEAGVGKDRLAQQIHAQSGRTGAFISLRCGALAEALVTSELFGHSADERGVGDPGRPGLLEAAHGGTLYLDGVEDAAPLLQSSLLSFLDSGETRRIGAQQPNHVDVRVIASTRKRARDLASSKLAGAGGGASASGVDSIASIDGVRTDLAQRLTHWVLAVPPLRARRDEVLVLAEQFVEQFAGEPRQLHRKLRLALLRHDYPGNIRELLSLVETAIIEHEGDGPIALTPGVVDRIQANNPETVSLSRASAGTSAGTSFLVASSGKWFRYDGERVEIEKRRTLCRLVRALVGQRKQAPGVPISVDDLLGAGWPDEDVLHEAGRNRVHVALTTLRKLGLRDIILRHDDGYLFDPDTPLRVDND